MKTHTMRNKFEAYNKVLSKRLAIIPAENLFKAGHDLKQWEVHRKALPFLADGKWKAKEAYIDAINDRINAVAQANGWAPSEPTHWDIQFWTKEGHMVQTACGLEDDRERITHYLEGVFEELGIDICHISRCKV